MYSNLYVVLCIDVLKISHIALTYSGGGNHQYNYGYHFSNSWMMDGLSHLRNLASPERIDAIIYDNSG